MGQRLTGPEEGHFALPGASVGVQLVPVRGDTRNSGLVRSSTGRRSDDVLVDIVTGYVRAKGKSPSLRHSPHRPLGAVFKQIYIGEKADPVAPSAISYL